jgi:hypothetical protein
MRSTQLTLASLFVSSLLIAPMTSFAQKRGDSSTSSPTARRDRILTREADIQNREFQLRLLNEPGMSPSRSAELSAEERKLIVNQIFEDFERLQVANRELMLVSSNVEAPAFKRMSTLAEEMNKRAKRLKTNLNIPDLDHPKKEPDVPPMDATQLRDSLQTLNASVKGFVTNPLFKDPRVTDVRHLVNLRRDIFSIIDLSRAVKKSAAKLNSH